MSIGSTGNDRFIINQYFSTVQYICSSSTLEIIMMNLGEEVLEAESLGGDFADSAAYRIKSLNPPIPVDQVSSGP